MMLVNSYAFGGVYNSLYCLKFDGLNDVVNFSNISGITNATFNFWAKMPTNKAIQAIVNGTIASPGMVIFLDNGGGNMRMEYRIAGGATHATSGFAFDTNWNMYTVTANTSTSKVRFYKNASLISEVALISSPNEFDQLGRWIARTDRSFQGNLDEFAIWDTALTDANILSLYGLMPATNFSPANLKLYYTFEQLSGTTVTDLSGLSNDGSLNNFIGTYWEAR